MKSSAQFNVIAQPSVAEHELLSKVVVVEHDADTLAVLKAFFEDCNLVGYRASAESALAVLGAAIDLGGVFLAETGSDGRDCFDLVRTIHQGRPDLPLFLRLSPGHTLEDLPPPVAKALAGVFASGDYARAKELIDTYLFSRHYPSEFVSDMKQMTLAALRASFKGMEIDVEQPYIVKDKLIYGELFSLIPIESNWCRGYMMIQTEEDTILEMIHAKKSSVTTPEPDFRHVNAVLGELSNMVWGSFKSRYGGKSLEEGLGQVRVEIPIIVNHVRKYISFGTDDPQLCFKFTVTDPDGKLASSVIYQKFIFSLDWAPEKYAESNQHVNELVSSGELELF
jgi:CheY-specific phosphatase CheX